ncbi:MAG: putative enoyl-CoA hydratase echA8 [Syntrophaceae bacterium PtaU1.Bin231]|nr:MAG: putative enoyl-CoA hydratase echA8 [Syntrophaceae bacterium PtaU1.Bin231]
MTYEFIRMDLEENIGTITLARPEKRNVLMEEVRLELLDAFDRLEKDAEARAVILTGGPDIFAAGANIKAMAEASPMEMYHRKRLPELCRRIEAIHKPVIAAVGGYCLGGGCELVLACDLRVAADNLRIGLPEVNIGIIPGGGGNIRLVRAIGKARAKELIFTGDFISAEEALRIGLVNRVVPKENLLQEARNLAKRCIRHSRHSLAMAKVAINIGAEIDLESAHSLEALAFCMMFSTSDQKEGMRAFLEKRKPVYEGRKGA